MNDALFDFGTLNLASSNLAALGIVAAFPDSVDLGFLQDLGSNRILLIEFEVLTTLVTNGTHLITFCPAVGIADSGTTAFATQFANGAASTLAMGPELAAPDAAGTGWAHVAEVGLRVYCAIPPVPVRNQDRVESPLVAASGGNHAGSFVRRRYLWAMLHTGFAVDTINAGTISARLVSGPALPYLPASGFNV